jgi:exonuclease SbcD
LRIRDEGDVIDRFATEAIERKVDLAIIAGDLFDNRRPSPLEILLAVRALRRLSDAGIWTALTPGNHDGMGTIADPETHTLLWMSLWASELSMDRVRVFPRPFVGPFGPVVLVSVPYPHKRAYDVSHAELPIEARIEAVSRDVGHAIEEYAIDAFDEKHGAPSVPRVFVGHMSLVSARLGAERAMQMGWDVTVSPEVLAPFDYAALGHIHQQQQAAPNAWYAGSPLYFDFAEEGEPKGFLLASIARGVAPEVSRIQTDTRGIRTVTWGGSGAATIKEGDIVRVVASVAVDAVEEQQIVAGLYEQGASWVEFRSEVEVQKARARSEIDPASGMTEMLREWCSVTEREYDDELERTAAELIASF